MKIAIISYWHVHAEGYTEELLGVDGCQVTAIWDEEAERGKKYAEKYSATYYGDYDELLADESIEAVVITAPTSIHEELVIKAIEAGKKIFSEKVLALSNEACANIKAALNVHDTDLVMSLPRKCQPSFLYAKQMVEQGKLGRITYARVRLAHNGSTGDWLPAHFYNADQCGGGAMIDLGAHPMYLLNWLLGTPISVQSLFTQMTGRGVEDNAVSTIQFESGAIGVAETGFVSVYSPMTLDISGTEGTLRVSDDHVEYANAESGGQWVEVEGLPERLPSPIVQWATGAIDERVSFGIEDAVVLTKMMVAAYESQETKRVATIE